uniref:CDC42 effector protein 2 n=1 Tax=Cairina moschata TaxID=8855 RepID=A0A8C3C0A1_CAIMO
MSTKAPIYLKRGGRKGKRAKLREVLSCDMISPPLGDFRHTIHVGSGGEGDTFGDVSFLRGKFHLLPRAEPPGASSFRFARTSTMGERPTSEADSPLLKNAPFLPHAGSLLSLHVDLGPSILEDVLQVMERHQRAETGKGKTRKTQNRRETGVFSIVFPFSRWLQLNRCRPCTFREGVWWRNW